MREAIRYGAFLFMRLAQGSLVTLAILLVVGSLSGNQNMLAVAAVGVLGLFMVSVAGVAEPLVRWVRPAGGERDG